MSSLKFVKKTLIYQKIEKNMIDVLEDLKKVVSVGFVGGSDYAKVLEQLGDSYKIEEIIKKCKFF